MADVDVADVAAEVQAHLDSWNAPPDDSGVTHLIGEQSQRGADEASGLPEVPTDEDGDPDYDQLKNADLQAHLEARGLAKSGNHDELVERLEEDDDSGE